MLFFVISNPLANSLLKSHLSKSRTEPLRGMSPFLAEAPGGDTLLDVHPTQLQLFLMR